MFDGGAFFCDQSPGAKKNWGKILQGARAADRGHALESRVAVTGWREWVGCGCGGVVCGMGEFKSVCVSVCVVCVWCMGVCMWCVYVVCLCGVCVQSLHGGSSPEQDVGRREPAIQ